MTHLEIRVFTEIQKILEKVDTFEIYRTVSEDLAGADVEIIRIALSAVKTSSAEQFEHVEEAKKMDRRYAYSLKNINNEKLHIRDAILVHHSPYHFYHSFNSKNKKMTYLERQNETRPTYKFKVTAKTDDGKRSVIISAPDKEKAKALAGETGELPRTAQKTARKIIVLSAL